MVITMPKKNAPSKRTEREEITSTEAAKILGVSKPVLLDYLKRGWLQGHKKGLGLTSAVMIYRDSLDRFIKQREIDN